MSNCASVITLALEKLAVVGAGQSPEDADLARGLRSLKGYYQKLINSAAFGELVDIVPATTLYEAGENERIVHDGFVTVNLPVEMPMAYTASDYGIVTLTEYAGMVRPPRDLAVVSVVNRSNGDISDYLYDNRVRRWCEINALSVDAYAPLSHRDENGLASRLATILAPLFSSNPVAPSIEVEAARFEMALTHNYSQAGRLQIRADYD